AGVLLSVPFVSPLAKSLRDRVSSYGQPSRRPTTQAAVSNRGDITKMKPARHNSAGFGTTALFPGLTAPVVFDDSIATFASSCTTPQSDFNVGDTVCVIVSGGLNRRLNWADPSGAVRRIINITSDPQSDSFTIPSTGGALDLGTWRVATLDT